MYYCVFDGSGCEVAGAPADGATDGRGGGVHAGSEAGVQRSHEDASFLHPARCPQERSDSHGHLVFALKALVCVCVRHVRKISAEKFCIKTSRWRVSVLQRNDQDVEQKECIKCIKSNYVIIIITLH